MKRDIESTYSKYENARAMLIKMRHKLNILTTLEIMMLIAIDLKRETNEEDKRSTGNTL